MEDRICSRCGYDDEEAEKMCHSCYERICLVCYSEEAIDWDGVHDTCPKCTDIFKSKLQYMVTCRQCLSVVPYENVEAFENQGFSCGGCGYKQTPMRGGAGVKRSDVYAFIDLERDFQDSTSKNFDHKGTPSFEAELLLLNQYAKKATEKWTTSPDNVIPMLEVRKIAAISVRCMENHGYKTLLGRTQARKKRSNPREREVKKKRSDRRRKKKMRSKK